MLGLHSCSSRSYLARLRPSGYGGSARRSESRVSAVARGTKAEGHSTAAATAGRPEPDRCPSTADPQAAAMTPDGRAAGLEESDGKHGGAQVNLLEQILSRENMLLAWKRVKANQGAAGMDGMSTDAFPEFARHHWERIRSALLLEGLEATPYTATAPVVPRYPEGRGASRHA